MLKPCLKPRFADAPAHGPGSIRITFITAFFWYRADLAMEVAAADPAWKNAELGVVAQIGAWYMLLGQQVVGC